MKIKPYLDLYNSVVDIDTTQTKRAQTNQLHSQLKEVRDSLCKKARSTNKVLEAQYAYVVADLSNRQKLWPYDPISFSRRIGELWESFLKATFYNARTPLRAFEPPTFKAIRSDILSKKVPAEVWDLIGDVNLKNDGVFYLNRKLHVVDLKSSFNSNEKGNLQRLRRVGMVYKLWKPRVKLSVLVREPEDNNHYLPHLTDIWDVQSGPAAYAKIRELTGINIQKWIKDNVRFEDHLDPALMAAVQKQNLEKYLKW